jgi:hypothetical protein
MLFSIVPFLAAAALAAPTIEKRSVSGNAIVNLNSSTGTPAHLASGFIYGLPDTKNQIPNSFYTDIDFGYGRAGGAQVAAPGRGWIWGLSEYKVGFSHPPFSPQIIDNMKNSRFDLQARCQTTKPYASMAEPSFS